MRRMLRTMLESDPGIRVVGEAANGRAALDCVTRLKPHVITMDVRMPVMDGLETTEHLMAYQPTPILVVTASLSRYDIDITFQMLGAGALDVIEKPDLTDPNALEASRRELIQRVKSVARMRVITHLRGRRRSGTPPEGVPAQVRPAEAPPEPGRWRVTRTPPQPTAADSSGSPVPAPPTSTPAGTGGAGAAASPAPAVAAMSAFPLVVIGASAGGPRIVRQIMTHLPASFPAAIIIAQHIADGFSAGMVEWLAGSSSLTVDLARDNTRLFAGTALVAPDGCDLVVQRTGTVRLQREPAIHPRPSVDLAMQTAAAIFGRHTIGVLLSGMGRDGALGMQAIRHAGGYTLAQDEATAPIYGMPRSAVELGAVDAVLPPEQIILALQRQATRISEQIAAASKR